MAAFLFAEGIVIAAAVFMIRILFLLIFCYYADYCLAQFNDSTYYQFNYRGTGTINRTDESSSYILNNVMQFNYSKNNFQLNTSNAWIYGEDGNSKTNNDYSAVIDLSFMKNKKSLYYWALSTYETSFSLKIDDRLQIGGGLGYYLKNKDDFQLVLSNGLLYEASDLAEADKYGRDNYETVRNSFRIKLRVKIKDRATFETTDFLQNSLSRGNDYIIRSLNVLSVKIYEALSITGSLTYNRLNLTGTENLLINYGVAYQKYF